MNTYIVNCGAIKNHVTTSESAQEAIVDSLKEYVKHGNGGLGSIIKVDGSELKEPLHGLTYDYLKHVVDDVNAWVPKYARTWESLSKYTKGRRKK